MMLTRLMTGIIAAGLILSLIYFGSPNLMTTVVLAIALLAYLEFDRMFFESPNKVRQLKIIALLFLSILSNKYNPYSGWISISFCFILIGMVATIRARKNQNLEQIQKESATEFLGLVYIYCLLGYLLPVVSLGLGGRNLLLLLFLIVFGGDTAAYIVGSRWGKRKLAVGLSPNKTIEGALAALVISVSLTVFWYFVIWGAGMSSLILVHLLWFSLLISGLAQSGDLFESLLKRSRSQKDSGNFLPGHGGVLDRIDGLVFAAPVFYVLITRVLQSNL